MEATVLMLLLCMQRLLELEAHRLFLLHLLSVRCSLEGLQRVLQLHQNTIAVKHVAAPTRRNVRDRVNVCVRWR